MTDKKLIKIARGFCSGLLGKKQSTNMCFKVCSPLVTYLSICGVLCELTKGEIICDGVEYGHFWITLSDGRIIDPTADQFIKMDGERMKNIWVEIAPTSYRRIEDKKMAL
jgi:hypothetical protein